MHRVKMQSTEWGEIFANLISSYIQNVEKLLREVPKEGDYPPLSPKELVKIYEKHFWFLSLPRQLPPLDAVLLGISETKKKKKKAGDLFFNPSRRGSWRLSS